MNIQDLRSYTLHNVDSFAKGPFGGNQTICVLGADSLTDDEMQKMGNEFTRSEISCVLKSQIAHVRLRYFSPTNEVPYCGHATIGALSAFAYDGLYGSKPNEITELSIETGKGIIDAKIDWSSPEPVFILDSPMIEMVSAPYNYEEIANGLGISLDYIDKTKPLLIEKTTNYLYFAVPHLDQLKRLKVNQQRAIEFTHQGNHIIVCAITNETFDPEYQVHARGFAPLVGILEDPFTGSMQGGLAAYALSQQMVKPNSKWIKVEQGHIMGRPGEVKLEIMQNSPLRVRLHAIAHHLFKTVIQLPKKI